MRSFWIIVGLLIVIAGAFAVVPSMRARQQRSAAMDAQQKADEARLNAENAQAQALAQAAAAKKEAESQSQANPQPPAVIEPPSSREIPALKEAPTAKTEDKAIEQKPSDVEPVKQVEVQPEPVKISDETAAELQKVLSGEPTIPAAETPGPAKPKVEEFKWVVETEEPKLESRPDGSQKIDDRFIITGEGTKEEPYVVSWEHLVSIQETFDPSQKKDKIPSRLHYIDNTYVKITGYICFPLYVPQPKELLAMLNQWDGCCIGVPPTAYDAIEVQLRRKVDEETRFAVHGSIVGKFQVKPYVTGNWLVGLYLMTDAEFEASHDGN